MQITIDMIKELREKTGCGIMDCRTALEKANGNMEAALEELREKGLKTAEKRADRVDARQVRQWICYPEFQGEKV